MNEIEKNFKKKMERCFDTFKSNIKKIHVGRILPDILDTISVKYYNTITPIRKISNITVENFSTLKIHLFDKHFIPIAQKEISNSDFNFNVKLINEEIYVTLPKLTEERRKNLIKIVRVTAENSRIFMRVIRRDFNTKIKTLIKNKEISEESGRHSQNIIQKMTDNYIQNINIFLMKKEEELIKF